MACTRGENQYERAHGIAITGNFRATSERIPRYFHKSSCMSSCPSESSQSPENNARSIPGKANRLEKSIQNRPKMVPRRCLGDTRGFPGASPGPVRACVHTELQIYEKLKASGGRPGYPRKPPGSQRDPKNRQKIDSLVKKDVPNRDYFSIFVHKAIFRAFPTISIRFFTKNLRKI